MNENLELQIAESDREPTQEESLQNLLSRAQNNSTLSPLEKQTTNTVGVILEICQALETAQTQEDFEKIVFQIEKICNTKSVAEKKRINKDGKTNSRKIIDRAGADFKPVNDAGKVNKNGNREKKGRKFKLTLAQDQIHRELMHDIRAQLAVISGSIQLIDSLEPSDNTDEVKELMTSAAKKVKNICRDTLKTIMDEKRIEELSPLTIVEDLLSYLKKTAGWESIQVQLCINDEPIDIDNQSKQNEGIPTITGNKGSLERTILNLLANSQKAIAQKERDIKEGKLSIEGYEPQIKLDISYDPEQKQVVITVEDNGIGIENDDMGSIFNGFSGFARDGMPGTGIGLRKDIEKAGGKLELDWSERGKGSRFQIILPTE